MTVIEYRPLEGTLREPEVVYCAKVIDGVACVNPLPAPGTSGYHSMKKYCDEHAPKSSTGAKKRQANIAPDDDVPAPKSVTNNFVVKSSPSRAKSSPAIAAVEEGAAAMLNLIPMIMAATGDDVCPIEIAKAIPAISHQLAVLSTYHPFIKKIFASGESTGEAMAWLGLIIATSPVIIAILSHHDLVSGKIAERIAVAAAFGKVVAESSDASTD